MRIAPCLLLSVTAAAAAGPFDARAADVDIAVVVDTVETRALAQPFVDTLGAFLAPGRTVVLAPDDLIAADGSREGLDAALTSALARDVDVVLALGPGASGVAVARGALPRPVVAPFAIPGLPVALPGTAAGTGVRNLAAIEVPLGVGAGIEALAALAPVRRVAVVASPALVDGADTAAIPGVPEGVAVQLVAWGPDLDLAALDVDGVVVGPLGDPGQVAGLARALVDARLPSFSLVGRSHVDAGILAGSGSTEALDRIARGVALHVRRILDGGRAEALATVIPQRGQTSLNLATYRAIGLSLTWRELTQLDLVGLDVAADEGWTLASATAEAVANNRFLQQAVLSVEADAQSIVRARSSLLPQASIGFAATLVDSDRAAAFNGTLPQFAATFNAEVSQLIYDNDAYAAPRVATFLQDARMSGLRAYTLDVARQTAEAWLQAQRAGTLLSVRRNNLDRTRENLELARSRVTSGAAGPDEVYRWEAELANAEQAVMDAWTQQRQARIELTRLLHAPMASPVALVPSTAEAPEALVQVPGLLAAVGTPDGLQRVADALVDLALEQVPELSEIDATLSAQETAFKAAKRAWWAPTVGVGFDLDQGLAAVGAGSDLSANPVPLDRTNFALSAGLSLPIFEGLRRSADQVETRTDLMSIEVQREAASEVVERDVRALLHAVVRSDAAVGAAVRAKEAALQNLDVVGVSYAAGVLPLIRLVDAQTSALSAELAEVDARFVLLSDLVALQRATGSLLFLDGDDRRDAFQAAVAGEPSP